MSRYHQQLQCSPADLDLAFWQAPEGVAVEDDELRFLLVPAAVEAAAALVLAGQVHDYQQQASDKLTRALIVTMGGMLPGILLHDHLAAGADPAEQPIEFGTIGVSLYAGPGERFDKPVVSRQPTVELNDQCVLLIDDLGDTGGTLAFLDGELRRAGARDIKKLVVYMKPAAQVHAATDFWFGETSQDTWIITQRERVETLVKRVPVWRERGASQGECRRRLVELIGYPEALVEYYLPRVFGALR